MSVHPLSPEYRAALDAPALSNVVRRVGVALAATLVPFNLLAIALWLATGNTEFLLGIGITDGLVAAHVGAFILARRRPQHPRERLSPTPPRAAARTPAAEEATR